MKKLIISLLATAVVLQPAVAATNTATMELIAHVTSSCQMVLGNSGAAEFNVIGGSMQNISENAPAFNSLNVLCTADTPYSVTMTARNAGRNANYNYALMNEQLTNPAQSPIPYRVVPAGFSNAGDYSSNPLANGVVVGNSITPYLGGATGDWSGLQPGSIILIDSGFLPANATTSAGATTAGSYGALAGYITFPFSVFPVATGSGSGSGLSNTSLQAGTYSDTLIFNQVF